MLGDEREVSPPHARRAALASVASLLCFVLVSCGYVGDVLPPTLDVPTRVSDLKAVQKGGQIEITYTVPPLTTESLPVQVSATELRIGAGPQPFEVQAWARSAKQVAVEKEEPGPVIVSTDARPFVGQEVAIAVRLVGKKGRPSGWSNFVSLPVVAPLPQPARVAAAADPRGVRLTWQVPQTPAGVSYRVYRQAPGESDLTVLATSGTTTYVDSTAQYGTAYRYAIQSVQGQAESSVSDVASITPVDTFPPAVPTGLNGLTGLRTIELNWDRNADLDFAGFRVYRSEASGQRQRIADMVPTPVYTDRQVEPGKRYQYVVTAVDQRNNESGPSNAVEVAAP